MTTKLEELRAAFEAATPGEWGVDSETHITKWDFGGGRCECRSIAKAGHGLPTKQSEENIANAAFIALAHNTMPALLEAVGLLKKAHVELDLYFDKELVEEIGTLLEKLK